MTHPTDDELNKLWFDVYKKVGYRTQHLAFARALLAEQARTQTHKAEHYRHAGWFAELTPSAMSYRLWEQGGHDQADGEVELFERVVAAIAQERKA